MCNGWIERVEKSAKWRGLKMPALARVVIGCVGGVTRCGEEGDDELEEESVIGLEVWLEVGLEGGLGWGFEELLSEHSLHGEELSIVAG